MRLVSLLIQRMPPYAKKVILSAGLRFGALALQFIGSVLIARQLGAANFGAYGYAFTWVTLIGAALGLGMGQLAVREVPRYLAKSEFGSLKGFILVWASGIFVTGTATYILLLFMDINGYLDLSVHWFLVFLAAAAHAIVLGLSSILSGFQIILKSQFLEGVLRQIIFLTIIISLILINIPLSVDNVFVISLFSIAPIIIIMLWILHREMINTKTDLGDAKYRFYTISWLSASLPLLLSNLTNQLQTGLDTLVLGAMVDDASLGIFRAAARGAELVMIAQGLSIQVLGPMLSRALAQGKKLEAQSLISQSSAFASALGISICGLMACFPEIYLGLFGDDFRSATPILWILLSTQALSILFGPSAIILIMHNRENAVLITTIVTLLINFGLKLFFVSTIGSQGAALATFISVVAMQGFLLIFCLRVTGLDPTLWTPAKRVYRKFFS